MTQQYVPAQEAYNDCVDLTKDDDDNVGPADAGFKILVLMQAEGGGGDYEDDDAAEEVSAAAAEDNVKQNRVTTRDVVSLQAEGDEKDDDDNVEEVPSEDDVKQNHVVTIKGVVATSQTKHVTLHLAPWEEDSEDSNVVNGTKQRPNTEMLQG